MEEQKNPILEPLDDVDLDVLSGMEIIFAHAMERIVGIIERAYEARYRQGIEVDMHISRQPKEGYREMWCFGFVGRSRCITQYKPQEVSRGVDCTNATVKHGSVYVDLWCEYDRFPDMPEGSVFPVYVKITRKEK